MFEQMLETFETIRAADGAATQQRTDLLNQGWSEMAAEEMALTTYQVLITQALGLMPPQHDHEETAPTTLDDLDTP